jgi:predicted ribosome quality control (RQC) complex YloA/Tae2 family protein
MQLTYFDLKALAQEIAPQLHKALFKSCYEAENRKFLLFFIHDRQEKILLICLKDPFLRFHLTNNDSSYQETSLSKKIQEYLKGSTLENFDIINDDRILKMTFRKSNTPLFINVELFPKKPNLYFLDNTGKIIFTLLPRQVKKSLPFIHPSAGEAKFPLMKNDEVKKIYSQYEELAKFKEKKFLYEKIIKKKLKKIDVQIERIVQDLQRCLHWEEVQHEAILLQSNLYKFKKGMSEITLEDWEKENEPRIFTFDPKREPHEEIVRRFKQSKKLRAGIVPLQKFLDKSKQNKNLLLERLNQLINSQTLEELKKFDLLVQFSPNKKDLKVLPYIEFFTESGSKIWVGKNAKSNDQLTFTLCNGADWWFHVSDFSGSHVILKNSKKGIDPDPQSIQDAAQLAITYSKAKKESNVSVSITQKKYISRLGKLGKVQLAKHKVMHFKNEPERVKIIKNRKTNEF